MKREDFKDLPERATILISYLDNVKNKSDLTGLEYASDIRLFFRFMKSKDNNIHFDKFDEIDISDIDYDYLDKIKLDDGYEFLNYCKNVRKNDSKARARKVTTLKTFFKYLAVHIKAIKENPFVELESPKTKKSLPKFLSLEQSRMLLNCVYNDTSENKERDYCIITLFLNCGLRLAELVGLNLSDIKDDGTMIVTGKGNKERLIYLNNSCLTAIRDYLKKRPADGIKDRNALFISRNRQRISRRMVQEIVNKYLDKCGLSEQGYSAHKLRHTAATLMYQHGDVDILLIKEILGHENLSTTQIYTHVSDKQLREAVNHNPLNDSNND